MHAHATPPTKASTCVDREPKKGHYPLTQMHNTSTIKSARFKAHECLAGIPTIVFRNERARQSLPSKPAACSTCIFCEPYPDFSKTDCLIQCDCQSTFMISRLAWISKHGLFMAIKKGLFQGHSKNLCDTSRLAWISNNGLFNVIEKGFS